MKRSMIFLFLFCLFACQKVSVNVSNVIFGLTLSQHSLTADGTTTINVSVQLPPNADVTKRNIKFTATSGSWKGGTDSTISVKAVFINNQLIAKAIYIAGSSPKETYITAQPDQPDVSNNNFVLKDSLTVTVSPAATIQLMPSSFGINSNYQSEVTLTGILKNASGNLVSIGTNVTFSDKLADGSAANGQYRKSVLTSDATSTVSTIYSVGAYPVGTVINITVTVLDASGKPTPIQDIVKLTVNK